MWMRNFRLLLQKKNKRKKRKKIELTADRCGISSLIKHLTCKGDEHRYQSELYEHDEMCISA